MVIPGRVIDILLQTGKGTKRLDMSALQIILAFCDVAGIIGYGMRDIIAGHGRNAQDCDGAGALKVDSLFVSGSQTAVKIARVPTVRRNLFHGDGHFLLGIGEVRHICQEDQYLLAAQGELFSHGQGQIRYECALNGRIRCCVDEHNRMAHSAALFQGVTESKIVVVFQSHAAQDDDIDLGLQGDPGEQLVVRLS